MKEIVLATVAAFCCMPVLRAQQQDDNVMSIVFTEAYTKNAPQEKLHGLEGTKITFSEDGEKMNLTVHEKTVIYDLSNVKGMTHSYVESPALSLTAHKDPASAGPYYATFYSSLEAYSIPEGVSAFTASTVESGSVSFTPIEDNVIPQGWPVLLQAESEAIELTLVPPMALTPTDNQLKGVDVETEVAQASDKKHYILSNGVYGAGFYLLPEGRKLAANKVYIALSTADAQMLTRGLSLSFSGSGTTGIESLDDTDSCSDVQIYTLSGQRIDQPEKALNIVNGKKVYIQ